MNALALYRDLKARGVGFEVDDDTVRVDAPAGELTQEDKAKLKELKPMLLKVLCRVEQAEGDSCRFDAKLSRHHGYTSLYDPTTDEWHDFPTKDCYPSLMELANRKRKKGGTA